MEDDSKLKITFYSILTLTIVAVVGIWESIIEPIISFLLKNIQIN
jgi:hypothetical protein